MASISNMEEAAALASEFVLSLDNLPHEVQFLLSEIRLKDARSQELQQDVNKDTAKYLKHGLRGQFSQKNNDVHTKAAADFAAAQALADEKVALAERLVALLTRTRARLDHDLGKMLVLQGELAPTQLATYSSIQAPGLVASAAATPVAAALESMRTSLAPEPVFSQSVSTAVPNKRRKLTGTTALKLASPAPSVASVSRGRAASRASPVASRARRGTVAAEMDEDAEGEDDVEEGEDGQGGEDDGIYCFCQRTSFGEMVACDNEQCPYQWFHLECVGLMSAPLGTWYCRECAPKFAAPTRKRGRK